LAVSREGDDVRSVEVFASVPGALIDLGSLLGIGVGELLTAAQIGAEALSDPDAHVDYETLPRIWGLLLERFPDRALGLEFAGLLRLDALGVVGYACRHAKDLGQALDLYVRYATVVDPLVHLQVEDFGEMRRVGLRHESRVEALIEPIELMVLAMIDIGAQLTESGHRPIELCFRHARKHPEELYASVAEVVRFEASYTGATFERRVLELPISGADPRIAGYLARQAESMLEEREGEAPLPLRVRRVVDDGLMAGIVDQASVAHALGMSARSLQRGLSEHGTSFSAQVDEVRRTRALALLRRPELTVAEVAFMLGYADPRPFYRCFRRWTGETPQRFRASHRE
jgi:AraC-like DNA-binding protein